MNDLGISLEKPPMNRHRDIAVSKTPSDDSLTGYQKPLRDDPHILHAGNPLPRMTELPPNVVFKGQLPVKVGYFIEEPALLATVLIGLQGPPEGVFRSQGEIRDILDRGRG